MVVVVVVADIKADAEVVAVVDADTEAVVEAVAVDVVVVASENTQSAAEA